LQAAAWLAFAKAVPSAQEQALARAAAMAALDGLPAAAKVEYQLEYGTAAVHGNTPGSSAGAANSPSPESVLLAAAQALHELEEQDVHAIDSASRPPTRCSGAGSSSPPCSKPGTALSGASTLSVAASATAAAQLPGSTSTSMGSSSGRAAQMFGMRHMEQLVRVHGALSKVCCVG
jgi:hypothetical protein